jgi:hypothetical protein
MKDSRQQEGKEGGGEGSEEMLSVYTACVIEIRFLRDAWYRESTFLLESDTWYWGSGGVVPYRHVGGKGVEALHLTPFILRHL